MAQAQAAAPPPAETELERDLLAPTLGPTPGLNALTALFGLGLLAGIVALFLQIGSGANLAFDWGLFISFYVFLFGLSGGCLAFVALLRLTHADYRRPLTRAFEAMSVFMLLGLVMFPFVARLLPAPGQRTLWVLWPSPVPWDILALIALWLIHLCVLWNGLLPDLAVLRDRIPSGWRHGLYRRLALGWRGTLVQWHYHDFFRTGMSYATLLMSVVTQTIIVWDLAMTFAPESASAVWMIQSGATFIFATLAFGVLILRILRSAFRLQAYIRESVFGVFGQFMMALTVIWFYLFFAQLNVMWYGGIPSENEYLHARTTGPFEPLWWVEVFCITILPFVTLIFRPLRHSMRYLTLLSIFILVGAYLHIFLNSVPFLAHPVMEGPELPWAPSILQIVGSIGLVCGQFFLYCLFIKLFPIVSLWDVRHERALETRLNLFGVSLPAIGKPEEMGTWSPVVRAPIRSGDGGGHDRAHA